MSLIAANVFAVMKNEKKVIVIINTKTAVVFFFQLKSSLEKLKWGIRIHKQTHSLIQKKN